MAGVNGLIYTPRRTIWEMLRIALTVQPRFQAMCAPYPRHCGVAEHRLCRVLFKVSGPCVRSAGAVVERGGILVTSIALRSDSESRQSLRSTVQFQICFANPWATTHHFTLQCTCPNSDESAYKTRLL